MELLTYDIVAEEMLDTPKLGPLQTFRLKPRPLANQRGNIVVELWFAPSLQYLPVRVLVTQGEMRLQAGIIRVEYDQAGGAIARLHASGGVLMVNATDAAESETAVYTIASGEVVMKGKVLMTQGNTAIKGDTLVINLKTGTGRMEGGVTTTFTPGGN